MDMDEVEIVDVEDGRDKDWNLSMRNAFKLVSKATDEVHLFCARKQEDKARWLQAYADERRRVQEDQQMGESPRPPPPLAFSVQLLPQELNLWTALQACALCNISNGDP